MDSTCDRRFCLCISKYPEINRCPMQSSSAHSTIFKTLGDTTPKPDINSRSSRAIDPPRGLRFCNQVQRNRRTVSGSWREKNRESKDYIWYCSAVQRHKYFSQKCTLIYHGLIIKTVDKFIFLSFVSSSVASARTPWLKLSRIISL